jgi:serine/threonine-protein kinase
MLADVSETDLQLPRRLGEYELVEMLGQGGMGEVYRALRAGQPDCVVKTVRPDRNTEQETLSRFKDEARVTMMLDHPNVARVFDFGRDDEVMYLVMELVGGGSVEDLVTRGQRLPEVAALRLSADILLGLDHAHRAVEPGSGQHLGVVHRDVSPQNALISAEGEVKLIDFGLAMSAVKQTKTADGSVVLAKLQYASPENARGEDVDHRSDQFSAAVIAAELLTGQRYYGDVGPVEMWRLASDGGYRPPHWASISSDVRGVLDRALHPRPEKRHVNCRKLAEALLEIVAARTGGGDGRRDLRVALGLEDDHGGDEPDTIGLDLEEARAIAAIASGEGERAPVESLPPEEATVVAESAISRAPAPRIMSLAPEEATVVAADISGEGLAPLDDHEATVISVSDEGPPVGVQSLAPDEATQIADEGAVFSSGLPPEEATVAADPASLPAPPVSAESMPPAPKPAPKPEPAAPVVSAPSVEPAEPAEPSQPSAPNPVAPPAHSRPEVSGPMAVAGGVRPALRAIAPTDEPTLSTRPAIWKLAALAVVVAGLLVGLGLGLGWLFAK